MNKQSGTQKRALPKLNDPSKDGQYRQYPSQEKSRTQPLSCPTIKGVVGEAISYYKGNNANYSNSHLNIFSVSFQGNIVKSNNELTDSNNKIIIPNPMSKDQLNRFRYGTFQKINRRNNRAVLDTSFLLGRFANNKGGVKIRNPRQAYVQIERINRSQRMRIELMERYASKHKKVSNTNNKMVDESKNSLKFINPQTEFSESLQKSIDAQMDEKHESLQIYSFGRPEQEEFIQKSVRFSSKNTIKIEQETQNEQKDNCQQEKKGQKQEIVRLYATRTNILQFAGKKNKPIKYPSINRKGYKFVLGPGNNCELVKKILQQRGNWSPTQEHDTLFHLRWQQYTDKSFYNRLNFARYKQLVNHLIGHEEISTKSGLVETLKHFLQRHQANYNLKMEQSLQCFNIVPITFSFDWDVKNKFEEELKRFIFYYCENHPDPQRKFKKERDYVELIKQITGEKNRNLNLTMNKNQLMRKNFFPPLSDVYKSQENQYLWIIKPSQLNRGRGIKIFSKLEDLAKILKQSISTGDFVIQKYIQKPMLLDGRKFDVRVWVLTDSEGQSYFFQEGYIRTSSFAFNLQDSDKNNQFIHLTNNAVQKNNSNYGLYEDGNQLSYQNFDKLMHKPQNYFKQYFLPTIKDICSLVMQAGLKKKMLGNLYSPTKESPTKISKDPNMVVQNKQKKIGSSDVTNETFGVIKNKSIAKSTFQLFGFDYMIDQNDKLWLIEVNTNPCIETSSKLLQQLVPRMIDDAFRKTVDLVFKPSTLPVYPVSGYEDSQNLWQPLNTKDQQIISKLKNYYLPVKLINPTPALSEPLNEDD